MRTSEATAQTRARIRRKINRVLKRGLGSEAARVLLEIVAFVNDMDERSNKKKGGLGR